MKRYILLLLAIVMAVSSCTKKIILIEYHDYENNERASSSPYDCKVNISNSAIKIYQDGAWDEFKVTGKEYRGDKKHRFELYHNKWCYDVIYSCGTNSRGHKLVCTDRHIFSYGAKSEDIILQEFDEDGRTVLREYRYVADYKRNE